MAEFDRLEVTTVFTTDSDLEFRPRRTTLVDSHLHEHANADLVKALERIGLKDARLLFVDIIRQEFACIVPRHTERHLCKIVRAEGEELGYVGDLIRK